MIYFDNAATSFPKPDVVKEAVLAAMDSFGNPLRGAHAFSLNASRCVERARSRAAELFGCSDGSRVVFTKNATEALNIAIRSVRGHIVTGEAEHNSVLRPVFRRNDHTVAKADEHGRYSVDAVERALRPDTGAVVLGHASNLTGSINPIGDIGRLCRARGIVFIVDAAQTAGLLDIRMSEQCVDALCFTGHKSLYGLQGTGGVCLGPDFTPAPLLVGGSGLHTFSSGQPPELPASLEAGTLNGHGLAALSAGMEYVAGAGPENLLAEARRVAEYFRAGLREIDGIVFYGDSTPGKSIPIVTINMAGIPSSEAADILAEEHGIAVRGGFHCAPLLHKALGTAECGAVRFSFSHFNTIAEAAFAIEAIGKIAARNR